jgi:hypothetical protein
LEGVIKIVETTKEILLYVNLHLPNKNGEWTVDKNPIGMLSILYWRFLDRTSIYLITILITTVFPTKDPR